MSFVITGPQSSHFLLTSCHRHERLAIHLHVVFACYAHRRSEDICQEHQVPNTLLGSRKTVEQNRCGRCSPHNQSQSLNELPQQWPSAPVSSFRCFLSECSFLELAEQAGTWPQAPPLEILVTRTDSPVVRTLLASLSKGSDVFLFASPNCHWDAVIELKTGLQPSESCTKSPCYSCMMTGSSAIISGVVANTGKFMSSVSLGT